MRSVHLYGKITGPRIVTNFRKAFGTRLLPGDFELAKTVNGRCLDNTSVRNVKEFTSFNALFNFYQNCHYCYIVPVGWRDYHEEDPEYRQRQETWWKEYSKFRDDIRQALKDATEDERGGKGKKTSTSRSRPTKGKQKAPLSDNESGVAESANEVPEATCCEICGGLFEGTDIVGHECRTRKHAARSLAGSRYPANPYFAPQEYWENEFDAGNQGESQDEQSVDGYGQQITDRGERSTIQTTKKRQRKHKDIELPTTTKKRKRIQVVSLPDSEVESQDDSDSSGLTILVQPQRAAAPQASAPPHTTAKRGKVSKVAACTSGPDFYKPEPSNPPKSTAFIRPKPVPRRKAAGETLAVTVMQQPQAEKELPSSAEHADSGDSDDIIESDGIISGEKLQTAAPCDTEQYTGDSSASRHKETSAFRAKAKARGKTSPVMLDSGDQQDSARDVRRTKAVARRRGHRGQMVDTRKSKAQSTSISGTADGQSTQGVADEGPWDGTRHETDGENTCKSDGLPVGSDMDGSKGQTVACLAQDIPGLSPPPAPRRIQPSRKNNKEARQMERLTFEQCQHLTDRISAYLDTSPYAGAYFQQAIDRFQKSFQALSPEEAPAFEKALVKIRQARIKSFGVRGLGLGG